MAVCTNGIGSAQNEIAYKNNGYIRNSYLQNNDNDNLFHLNLSRKDLNFKATFGDVKFVCIGGTAHRMKNFAYFIMKELELPFPNGSDLKDLTGHGHRYSMYKVGCVLCVNHGMGYPSIMILLNEVIKLLYYAEVEDPIIFRIGTSGGSYIPNGTVVISNEAVNDYFEPYCLIPVLGKTTKQRTMLDQNLISELQNICENNFDFPIIVGKTMSNEHFYESTASKYGLICEYSDEDRNQFFGLLKKHKVVNLDMEAVVLSSLTHKLGIKSAIINVVVNSVTTEELIVPTEQERKEWEKRPQKIVLEYIKQYQSRNK